MIAKKIAMYNIPNAPLNSIKIPIKISKILLKMIQPFESKISVMWVSLKIPLMIENTATISTTVLNATSGLDTEIIPAMTPKIPTINENGSNSLILFMNFTSFSWLILIIIQTNESKSL